MTSTSSSSSDRITACAPVICCGATCFGCGWACRWAGAGGRAVGAVRRLRWSRGGCAHGVLLVSAVIRRFDLWGSRATKNPRQRQLHEGCASMLVGSGLVTHQRADQLLRASRGCIAVDGSLRTAQRSNSLGRRGSDRMRRPGSRRARPGQCKDGRREFAVRLRCRHAGRHRRSRRWPISPSGSSPSDCWRWCSPSRRWFAPLLIMPGRASVAIFRLPHGRRPGHRHRAHAAGQQDGALGRTSTDCGSTGVRGRWPAARTAPSCDFPR